MDKDTMSWTRKAISAPVYDNWWQTGRVILDLLTHLGIEVIYLNGIFFSRFILLCEDLLTMCSTYIIDIKNSAYVICNEKLKRKFMVSERLFYKETVVLRCNGEVKTKRGIHRSKGNAIGLLYRQKTRGGVQKSAKLEILARPQERKGRRETLETRLPQPHPVQTPGFLPVCSGTGFQPQIVIASVLCCYRNWMGHHSPCCRPGSTYG